MINGHLFIILINLCLNSLLLCVSFFLLLFFKHSLSQVVFNNFTLFSSFFSNGCLDIVLNNLLIHSRFHDHIVEKFCPFVFHVLLGDHHSISRTRVLLKYTIVWIIIFFVLKELSMRRCSNFVYYIWIKVSITHVLYQPLLFLIKNDEVNVLLAQFW